MKKNILGFIVVIVIALAYYFVNNTKKGNEDVAKSEKVINIGVLQLLSHPALDSILKV